jgi:hypothetical protein
MFYALCDRLMAKHGEQNLSDLLLTLSDFFANSVQMKSKLMPVLKVSWNFVKVTVIYFPS